MLSFLKVSPRHTWNVCIITQNPQNFFQ